MFDVFGSLPQWALGVDSVFRAPKALLVPRKSPCSTRAVNLYGETYNMSLKIIGAGPGRTGTLSLKTALEHLGYAPCHHMKSCFEGRQQTRWFLQAAQGGSVDWRQVFSGYEAAVDWPAAAYYQELLEVYPDAKVIFSDRSPEDWYESVASTIFRVLPAIPGWLRRTVPHIDRVALMVDKTVWKNELNDQFENRAAMLDFFERRRQEVIAAVPPQQLLIHSAAEGWGPLCAFLGVEVPSIPYPWVNEGARIRRGVRVLKALSYVPSVLLLAGILTVVYGWVTLSA